MRTLHEVHNGKQSLANLQKLHQPGSNAPLLSEEDMETLAELAFVLEEVEQRLGVIGYRPPPVEKIHTGSKNPAEIPQFSMVKEQMDAIPVADFTMSIHSFCTIVWEYAQNPRQVPLKETAVLKWLLKHKYIQEDLLGKAKCIPTDRGTARGFCLQERHDAQGILYYTLAADSKAQAFLKEKLPRMVGMGEENSGITLQIPEETLAKAEDLMKRLHQELAHGEVAQGDLSLPIVEDIFQAFRENQGYFDTIPRKPEEIVDKNTGGRLPFAISPQEQASIPVVAWGIRATNLCNIVNAYRICPYVAKLTDKDVKAWLFQEGYLSGKFQDTLPTEKGIALGITRVPVENGNFLTVYDSQAQKFVYSHLYLLCK